MWTKQKLGVAAWTMGQRPLLDIARRIQTLNYDGLTLTVDPDQDTAESVSQTLGTYNLELFAIAPLEVDIAHPVTAVRKPAITYFQQIVDMAAQLGRPLVTIRGMKGRSRPVSTLEEEMRLLETAVHQIAQYAAAKEVRLVIEVLNRYETHLIHTGAAALELVKRIGLDNVGIMLNAFHMNIEEQDAAAVMRRTGDLLWLFTMSDSNRRAIGRGHIKLGNHLWALEDIGYSGPIVLECLPPHFDLLRPFTNDQSIEFLENDLRDSRSWF